MAKKVKTAPYPVMVIWKDILDDEPTWKHGDVSMEPQEVQTVAFLLKNEKDKVILIRDHYTDDNEMVTGGRVVLPKGAIVKIIKLEPSK